MIKRLLILIGLLLMCGACVSRTITTSDGLTGSKRQLSADKKIIWFWQDEFSE